MGGDVKLFRAGANELTVDAAVDVNGAVNAKSIKIGSVSLDEYIHKIVEEILEGKRN